MNSPAIILSHGPGGLGAVRSLARRGVRVTAIAVEASDPVLHSRLAAERLVIPGEDDSKESNLLELLADLPAEGAAILTTSDRMVTFLANNQEALKDKFRFQLPSAGLLEALNDKRQETELVRRLGFAIPETIANLPSDPSVLMEKLRFPIILKPHVFSVQEVFPHKNAVLSNREELEQFYSEWRHALHVLLAQEVIPGPDSASWICSCTFDERHRLLDCAIKQKLRALPAHFGGSSFAASRTNVEILELARSLGRKLEYVGHAGIEFRWDRRDNKYRYIELNPRLPANVGFDEACGMPTVWNSYRIALGESTDAAGAEQDEGVSYLDFKSDFFSLRSDGMSRLSSLRTVLRHVLFQRTNGPYFAWDDPMPGLMVAKRFLGNAAGIGRNTPPENDATRTQKA